MSSFGRISPGGKVPEIKSVRVERDNGDEPETLVLDLQVQYKGNA